jgi:mannose-1-phosphate guanylyltransferase/mannose-6-phosphate isomerase
MLPTVIPVILAGGSGTRLWPLSRKNYPKQFLALQDQQSLLQQTLARANTLETDHLLIIANDAHYFLCQEQLQPFQYTSNNADTNRLQYLLEPIARNTAAAITSAALHLLESIGQEATLLILPSDHYIQDLAAWREAMLQAIALAQSEAVLVTFGITPSNPHTGYGYIKAGNPCGFGAYTVDSFHEKPNQDKALSMLAEPNYFWNSGMFVARAQVLINAMQEHAPDILLACRQALNTAYRHHDFIR